MSENLFVYGTLMHPEIFQTITGTMPEYLHAVLPGFRRGSLRERAYPGLLPSEGSSVNGVLVVGLDDAMMKKLDTYEGEEYQRIDVRVHTDNGNTIEACCYALRPEYANLMLPDDWDFDTFTAKHLTWYLQICRDDASQPPRRKTSAQNVPH